MVVHLSETPLVQNWKQEKDSEKESELDLMAWM